MPFPPPTLPTNRSNSTPQNNTHPADHNQANQAINDIVAELQQFEATRTQTFGPPANVNDISSPVSCGTTGSAIWRTPSILDVPANCAYVVGWGFLTHVWSDTIGQHGFTVAIASNSVFESSTVWLPVSAGVGNSFATAMTVPFNFTAPTAGGGIAGGQRHFVIRCTVDSGTAQVTASTRARLFARVQYLLA